MRPRTSVPSGRGRSLLFAAALFLAGVFTVGAGLGVATGGFSWPDFGRRPPPSTGDTPALEPSAPIRLAIPAIGVRAPVAPVGLAKDGSIEAPAVEKHNEAGWFSGGPTPGQSGPAIVVGHVDTRTGPSIFFKLHTLKPGDTIEVTREDRRVAVFRVVSVERFGKSTLPADRVYGDFRRPALRLITCGGAWRDGSYTDNVVVFADLVAARR